VTTRDGARLPVLEMQAGPICAEGDEDILKARHEGRYDRVERKRTVDGGASWQTMAPMRDVERRQSEQFQSSESLIAASRLREESGYVRDLIRVLQSHAGGRRRWAVMQAITKAESGSGVPGSREFRAWRRKRVSAALRGSGVFNKTKSATNLPCSIGRWARCGGVWAVYSDKAEAWIAERR